MLKRTSECLLTALCWWCIVPNASAAPLNGREVSEDIFYQFMPIAWRDSDNDPFRFGDFDGMTASLDYLENLGITAVWMNPIFPSPAYHGYQHGPGDQINARFGTEAQFLNFVQQAHARGIKVFIDFVVYGISQDAIWFQDAFGNPSSPYDNWLAFTNSGNTNYLGSVYTTWNGDTVGFIHWNLDHPNPTGLVTTWAQHWLDPNGDGDPADGIDGYRLDHVWEQYPSGPNGWGYNLDWWITWRDNLRTVYPDVFIFAEQADWGITGANLLPAFDATMTKPWEFAVRDALSNEDAGSLYSQTAATLASLPSGKYFLGIIGDHDVDRLTSVIGGSLEKAKAAAAVLLTSPFPPMIYTGDEIGMLGFKGNYGSDANDIPMREPFKWNAVAGPPMSNYWVLNSQAFNNAYSSNNDGRSVEEQSGVAGSLLEEYKLLIAARKAHVALRRGTYIPITATTTRVWAFLRYQDNTESLMVAVNLRGSPTTFDLDLSAMVIPGGSTTVQDVITGQLLPDLNNANRNAYQITLGAYRYHVLAVNLQPPAPDPTAIDGIDIPDSFTAAEIVATQDNATGLGDNISELDQLFVRFEVDGYRVGITGNLATDGTGLALLFDTISGGQNVLDFNGFAPPPAGPDQLTGLRLDGGFAPDHMIFVNTFGGSIWVDQYVLPTGSPAAKTYRGTGTVNDGDGLLTGGTNPNGMQVAMNNTNSLGVTGTDPSGAATARHGFEMFIPYADIGAAGPGATVGVSAFIMGSSGDVSNQWLPGLGGGQSNLGVAPDLTTVPGDQFVLIAPQVPGDLDGDGDIDFVDLGFFVGVLVGTDLDAQHIARSDLNLDGNSNGEDVSLFVSLMLP
ncbi:MAG: alpha-amylase family glycosyl hydrolase [Phycisphaerae bacterium]